MSTGTILKKSKKKQTVMYLQHLGEAENYLNDPRIFRIRDGGREPWQRKKKRLGVIKYRILSGVMIAYVHIYTHSNEIKTKNTYSTSDRVS